MAKIINSYNEETIRTLAHQRWIEEGRPEGQADAHWRWALATLAATAKNSDGSPAADVKVAPVQSVLAKAKTVLATSRGKSARAAKA